MGNQGEKSGGILGTIGEFAFVLIILVLLTLFMPGMLVLSIFKTISGMTLDYGQMWTFSILLSIAILIVIRLLVVDIGKALKTYAIICGLIVALMLVLHFGFKIAAPLRFLGYFFDIS